jgi:hypothetical protein
MCICWLILFSELKCMVKQWNTGRFIVTATYFRTYFRLKFDKTSYTAPLFTIFIMFKLHLLQSTSRVTLRRGLTELPYWRFIHTALIAYHMHILSPCTSFWCILLNDLISRAFSIVNLIHVGFQNLRLTYWGTYYVFFYHQNIHLL